MCFQYQLRWPLSFLLHLLKMFFFHFLLIFHTKKCNIGGISPAFLNKNQHQIIIKPNSAYMNPLRFSLKLFPRKFGTSDYHLKHILHSLYVYLFASKKILTILFTSHHFKINRLLKNLILMKNTLDSLDTWF